MRFDRPLRIPTLAASTLDDDGRRHLTITAQDGETEFRNGTSTPTRGFDGSQLGPTLVRTKASA